MRDELRQGNTERVTNARKILASGGGETGKFRTFTQAALIGEECEGCAVTMQRPGGSIIAAHLGPPGIAATGMALAIRAENRWAAYRIPGELPPTPDDGSGCCSALPPVDLPGAIRVETFDAFGNPTADVTLGPFIYHPGSFGFYDRGMNISFSNVGGYYETPGVCVTRLLGGCVDFGSGIYCDWYYRSQRVKIVLACTTVTLPLGYHPEAYVRAGIPHVRLFVLSNYGQKSDAEEGPPGGCADYCPPGSEGTGFGDCELTPPYTLSPYDVSWLQKWRYVLSTIAHDVPSGGFGSPGLWAINCDPANICYAVDSYYGVRLTGSIGLGSCEAPDPDEPGCRAYIALRRWCGGCPEPNEEGELEPSWVSAWHGPDRVGFGTNRWEQGAGGECLGSLVSIPVNVPIDPDTALPVSPFNVDLYLEPAHQFITTVTIEDCQPVGIEEGVAPDRFRVRWCLEGCPEGALPIASATVELLTEDESEILYSTGIGEQGGDCVGVIMDLPEVGGDYKIRLSIQPVADGYAEKVVTFARTLPNPGTECLEIDLGTITADPNEDHICTCGGLVEKCLTWNGNGSEVQLDYVEGFNPPRWEGQELVMGQRSSGSGGRACLGSDPDPIPINIVLTLNENCEWVATRDFYACFITVACGAGTTRRVLSDDNGQERHTTSDPVSSPTWGPLLRFGGDSLPNWSSTSDPGDPSHCLVPDEGYTAASFSRCSGFEVGGLMMARAASGPASEPPLPSKRRMAGQLARTVVATVAHAVKGQPTRTSAAEQARRWAICRACDHFRASDRRCGKIDGCGCWLDQAIPRAAKSCPLKPPKWVPEATGPVSTDVSQ